MTFCNLLPVSEAVAWQRQVSAPSSAKCAEKGVEERASGVAQGNTSPPDGINAPTSAWEPGGESGLPNSSANPSQEVQRDGAGLIEALRRVGGPAALVHPPRPAAHTSGPLPQQSRSAAGCNHYERR